MEGVPLDALVTRMLSRSPFDYRVAADDSEREIAYWRARIKKCLVGRTGFEPVTSSVSGKADIQVRALQTYLACGYIFPDVT